MIGLLIALYPAHWRRRYGEEFRAVLEMRPLGPFDVADVLIGALDARLAPRRLGDRSGTRGGHRVLLRMGGFGAIAGGILWVTGLGSASFFQGELDRLIPISLLVLGTLGLLLALIGLSAFQGHRDPRLAWPAFGVPALGTLVSVVGIVGIAVQIEDRPLVGELTPWSIWLLGMLTMFIGSVLFAIATLRAAVLSRAGAVTLGVSSAVALLLASGVLGVAGDSPEPGWVMPAIVAAFGASWVALGISALRRGPIRAIATA